MTKSQWLPGASRGLGKGIALGLGEAGATVYITGRSTTASGAALPGTIEEPAAEVTELGDALARSGETLVVTELAAELGISD